MTSQTKLLSRRSVIKHAVALSALASAQLALPNWMPRLAFAKDNVPGDVLVCVFLRGGADGMSLVIPHGDKDYYTNRPHLGVPRPDDKSASETERVVDLDGFFGLNPAGTGLASLFKAGQMIAIHATGSPDPSRSHFDAMSYMELGTPGDQTIGSGWLGRHLNTLESTGNSPLRAVGWGSTLQQSLRGSINAVSMKSIIDYHLPGQPQTAAEMLAALNALYATAPDAVKLAADQTQAVTKINIAGYQPANGTKYGDLYGHVSDFDLSLMQTAALIKANVGLEVAAIDLGGWDTHENQMANFNHQVAMLTNGLTAFHQDMGDGMKNVTLVVMSEFGRRLRENASLGTDHGHGNMMMIMSPHVAKKPVIANWPGLDNDHLDSGDLRITIDYRDVLSEILTTRLNNPHLDVVFPGFTPTPRGIVTA